MTASHSSADMLTSMRSRRIPALLTRMWRSPKVVTAWSIMRLAPSQSATSSKLATADPPAAVISSTTCWAGEVSAPVPSGFPAEVVHHHLGTLGGEEQRVLPADSPSCSGDDRHSAFQFASLFCLLSGERLGRRPSVQVARTGLRAIRCATNGSVGAGVPPVHPPRGPVPLERSSAERLGRRSGMAQATQRRERTRDPLAGVPR